MRSDTRDAGPAATGVARKRWSRRAWLLTSLAAAAGILLGIAAIVSEGAPRASFAAASVVCLAMAVFCVATVWLETSDSGPIDFEAPPPEPPVPQSSVDLIYDPRTRDEAPPE